MLPALVSTILLTPVQSDIDNLHHKEPAVRRNAADILKLKKDYRAIPALIQGLSDANADVRAACHEALKVITGKSMDQDERAWMNWWDKEGRSMFPTSEGSAERLETRVKEAEGLIARTAEQMESRVKEAEGRISTYVWFGFTALVLVILVMFYFTGHVSSRSKELKEIMKQVDAYIREGKQVSDRVDAIMSEVERKKNDLLEFYGKLKGDSEDEIGRYADVLQQKSDHHLREEVMSLRQKAEKELESTLGEIKVQMDHEMRKLIETYHKRLEEDSAEVHQKFLREVEANRLFMEGVFYHTNHRYDDALRIYRRLVVLKPDHVLSWLKLGDAYREHLQFDEARDAYQRALDLAPQDSRACYSMAALFGLVKNREQMLEFLRRAISNDGEFKDEALNDQAFREYWHDPAFKDIAES